MVSWIVLSKSSMLMIMLILKHNIMDYLYICTCTYTVDVIIALNTGKLGRPRGQTTLLMSKQTGTYVHADLLLHQALTLLMSRSSVDNYGISWPFIYNTVNNVVDKLAAIGRMENPWYFTICQKWEEDMEFRPGIHIIIVFIWSMSGDQSV